MTEKEDPNLIISEHIKSINNDSYTIKLILTNLSKLIFKIYDKNSLQEICHQKSFNFDELKLLNKCFLIYDNIKDIYNCIKALLDEDKVSILFKNENMSLSIPFFLPNGKQNIINFDLEKDKINKDELIQVLCNKIKQLEKIIISIKESKDNIINDILKRLQILEEKENEREKEKEKLRLKDIRESSICKENEINLFVKEFKKHQKFLNEKIGFKLLYKATRDGDKVNNFHNKCDNIKSVLVLIKSNNGARFGGYTEIGFNDHTGDLNDDNAFVFSLDKMKIFNAKKGTPSIYCQKDLYGFKNTIYLYDDSLTKKSNWNFGGNENYPCQYYELNNNEDYFICSEVEVFQILDD